MDSWNGTSHDTSWPRGISVTFKKILNILIFLAILLNTAGCLASFAATDIETKQKEAREQINRLKWLEQVETNKLYKNQQKLENAANDLSTSKTKILSAQKEIADYIGIKQQLFCVVKSYVISVFDDFTVNQLNPDFKVSTVL